MGIVSHRLKLPLIREIDGAPLPLGVMLHGQMSVLAQRLVKAHLQTLLAGRVFAFDLVVFFEGDAHGRAAAHARLHFIFRFYSCGAAFA